MRARLCLEAGRCMLSALAGPLRLVVGPVCRVAGNTPAESVPALPCVGEGADTLDDLGSLAPSVTRSFTRRAEEVPSVREGISANVSVGPDGYYHPVEGGAGRVQQ